MTEQQRYEQVDLPFYNAQVAPILPPAVLDFHAHAWKPDQRLDNSFGQGDAPAPQDRADVQLERRKGATYMVTQTDYGAERLLSDGQRIFPGRRYNAVFFGNPTPAVDVALANSYVAESARSSGLYPLIVVGRDRLAIGSLKEQIVECGFFGYKVFLDWLGDDYGEVAVEDMIGPAEMQLADQLGLIVLLHVPRARRLADPDVQSGVRAYALRYPNARIVLAHCGRCYLPDEIKDAVPTVRDLENVYVDTSMVMDPMVLRVVFENIDSRRVLFGTDFPVAAMRGRRVRVMDHWVDVVLEGYPPSAFRVASNGIRATFMAYEIVLAIKAAGEMAGLHQQQIRDVFFENGMAVLAHVANGEQLKTVQRLRTGKRAVEHTP